MSRAPAPPWQETHTTIRWRKKLAHKVDARRGDRSRAVTLQDDLGRYYELIDRTLETINLTDADLRLLVEALDGYALSIAFVSRLGDYIEQQPEYCQATSLIRKLRRMSLVQLVALADYLTELQAA